MEAREGVSCEVIDLRTLLPWDRATVGAPDVAHQEACHGFPHIINCHWQTSSVMTHEQLSGAVGSASRP